MVAIVENEDILYEKISNEFDYQTVSQICCNFLILYFYSVHLNCLPD